MERWSFAKYEGSGNDFILFDNRLNSFPKIQSVIQSLCHRQKGIGADGLLLLENSLKGDFSFRIFNSDGSEAEMCGNGLLCFVKWLCNMGCKKPSIRIEVKDAILITRQIDEKIQIEMHSPKKTQWNIPITYENQKLIAHSIDTGVPHAVFFTEDVEKVDILQIGAHVRNHSLWGLNGTNVTFAQVLGEQKLKIRTFERGVEGETLACGTGATAAALAAAHQKCCLSPITVGTRSGQELWVEFSFEENFFSNVNLTGSARCIFFGEIDLRPLLFDCT